MNVQVNEGLPTTAYLKMIDIWLIFNLIVPFLLILVHTYMDTLRSEASDAAKDQMFPSTDQDQQIMIDSLKVA